MDTHKHNDLTSVILTSWCREAFDLALGLQVTVFGLHVPAACPTQGMERCWCAHQSLEFGMLSPKECLGIAVAVLYVSS